jgi:hypothetical protein
MPKSKQREKKHLSHNRRLEKKIEAVQRLNPSIASYIKKLESDNERMKTDPETTLGQLVPQMREAIAQNKRLSVLAAALIDINGGSALITKEALEAFETKVLSIKWTLPEGVEKVDDAKEFIFTYEALTQEETQAKVSEVTVASNNDDTVVTETEPTREERAQKFVEESGKEVHTNDCATSVAPAEEPGPCDCEVPVINPEV